MCIALEVKIVPAVLSTKRLIPEYPSEALDIIGQIFEMP
jgi:hypothetical protein